MDGVRITSFSSVRPVFVRFVVVRFPRRSRMGVRISHPAFTGRQIALVSMLTFESRFRISLVRLARAVTAACVSLLFIGRF